MNDLPLTTNLTDLPIGTLLRKRNGQVRKMIAITSDHPDAPIVLDDGCCVAVNGKADNWPINDIIGIAGWPPLDQPHYYFVTYVMLDDVGSIKFKGCFTYKTLHGSPVTDNQFFDRLKQHIDKEYPEQSDLAFLVTSLNELQP